MKKIILLVILVLNILACDRKFKHNSDYEESLIQFVVPGNINRDNIIKYDLNQFYSKVDGFELDRNGGPIGRVDKVQIFKNILFVLDVGYAKKLFAYDLKQNGKFLFSLGNKGKGPGEFLRISDFTIDSINNHLIIADIQQQKISYFDLKGKFQKENRLNFSPLEIYSHRDYLYFINNANKKNDMGIKVTDKNLKILKEYFSYNDFPLTMSYGSAFFEVENKLLLNYPNCDTIFQFKELAMTPYLVMETGEYSFLSYAKENGINSKNIMKYIVPKNNYGDFNDIVIPQSFFEDNKLRSFSFRRNIMNLFIIQSKFDNNHQPAIGFLYDDFTGLPVNLKVFNPEYGTGNIVSSSSLIKIDLSLLEKNKEIISHQLIQEIRNADVDSNPFIIFYK